jgi:D-alanine-D-alanine ligase-like ATP-grasp enzyme
MTVSQSLSVVILYVSREHSPYREAGGFEVASQISSALSHAEIVSKVELFDVKTLANLGQRYGALQVMNLVYGYKETTKVTYTQPETTAMIEQCGLRPIGSPSTVQMLAQDKYLCGNILAQAGFSVPRVISPGDEDIPPLLVRKPRYGAAHRGVSLFSSSQLRNDDFSEDLLIQEYEHGDEYTVGIIECKDRLIALAPLKIQFATRQPCVLGEALDWDVAPDLEDTCGLTDVAKAIFRQLGMHGFGRIDFRISGSRKCVLDVNSLPNLHPQRSFLPLAAHAMGWTYDRLIQMLTGVC